MKLFYRFIILIIIAVIVLLFDDCNNSNVNRKKTLFKLISPKESGVDFVNKVNTNKFLNIVTHEDLYNGAGVGIGDINNDGFQDIFLASNMGRSRLYFNKGNFRFQDITKQSGIQANGKWVNGIAFVDINNDGYLDIYLSCGGPYTDPKRRANELYINNGDHTFTEEAKKYGIADTGFTTQTALFDYNKDGFLDLYLLTNGYGDVPPNVIRPKKKDGTAINTDRLYRNNGDGSFTNVSNEAGIKIEGNGLGIVICDINKDGLPDVYIANDYLSNDLLYTNNGDGTFTDMAGKYFRHQSYAAMGTDIADINNDGFMDIMTLDMRPEDNHHLKRMYGSADYYRYRSELLAGYDPQFDRNTLQLNNGFTPDGKFSFSEIGQLSGVSSTDWSWSALFGDFDNDGWKDLLVTNGIPRNPLDQDFADYKIKLFNSGANREEIMSSFVGSIKNMMIDKVHNYLFKNNGNLTFTDNSIKWGFTQPSYSTGAAYADLNNDGYLDIVINNVNENAFVYKNRGNVRNHRYLEVKLIGPKNNSQGLGTKLTLHSDGRKQYSEYSVYRGYKSSMATPIHFGIKKNINMVDSLVVIWPGDRRQVIRHIKTNQLLKVIYDPKSKIKHNGAAKKDSIPSSLFTDVTKKYSINFKHREQEYDDFKNQPLLPHKFSENGPGLATGDVNNDGREDFFVGGAFKQSGKIFIQRKDGTFEGHNLDLGPAFEKDTGILFFDANKDSNLDLYVASGGSEFLSESKYYQDRLYFGNGKGEFYLAQDALPKIITSTSIVTACDFDKDGDLDLFIGGRVVPGQYPKTPESYLLENRGDVFKSITEEVAPSLKKIGMVTSAIWSDFNNDGWSDLIIVGEWMSITVFENKKGHLIDVTNSLGLAKTRGWWNSIVAGDFNKDGYTDYVVGNLGLNTSLKNKPGGHVKITFGDFNNNGTVDPIISRIMGGARYPVALYRDMILQIPTMKRRFPSYKGYSGATLTDLLTHKQLKKATSYMSNTFKTSYIENKNGTAFKAHPLPVQAQFAPVFGILTDDYNCDSNRDILMIGNSFAPEVFTGRYDAFNGLFLEGNGKGNFTPVSIQKSGFYVDGDGKALTEIMSANGGDLILVARNNGKLKAFERTSPCRAKHIPATVYEK